MTSTVATKDDLIQLENRLDKKFDAKFEAFEKRMVAFMDTKMDTLEQRMYRHFHVIAEDLIHDFRGAHKDKISQHEDRILVLEKRVGIKA